MNEMIKKEFKLTACPLSYIFIAFSLMTMIPGYPILVGAFFVCLGLLYTFQFAREFNDIMYTALLPIKKSDVVKSRYMFVITIEIMGFALCVILTLVRMIFLSGVKPYVENPLMNANFIYLGAYLVILALFNIIFVRGFFKTAYYFGKPFIIFSIFAFLFIGIMETLHHLPGLESMNVCGFENMGVQTACLAAGVCVYVAATFLAVKQSVRDFDVIDL